MIFLFISGNRSLRLQQILLALYVLFFATGFMGVTALFILRLRLQSRLIQLLLVFQILFLVGVALVALNMYLYGIWGTMPIFLATLFGIILSLINAALYAVSIVLIRRISTPYSRRKIQFAVAEIFAGLVILKSLISIILVIGSSIRSGSQSLLDNHGWSLAGYLLTGLAMVAFGISVREPLPPGEPPVIRSLVKAYGTCAIVFAPMGLVEYAFEYLQLPGIPFLSLDHLFYLSWNIISMKAAVRLLKPGSEGVPVLDSVPQERVEALGLSNREAQIAVLIARGLSNKEIASELGISPATVRTHIYNLYQKAGVRSRVELINRLRV